LSLTGEARTARGVGSSAGAYRNDLVKASFVSKQLIPVAAACSTTPRHDRPAPRDDFSGYIAVGQEKLP